MRIDTGSLAAVNLAGLAGSLLFCWDAIGSALLLFLLALLALANALAAWRFWHS